MKALVVENSATIRAWIRGILEAAGMEVRTAADGLEGVAVALAERPDVVLMDLHMPRVDGIEATARILREISVPVVAFSAAAGRERPGLTFEALEAGALDLLPKPTFGGPTERLLFEAALVGKLREAARARPVTRFRPRRPPRDGGRAQLEAARVLAIGASTGGPQLIHRLLVRFARPPSVPVVIAQHIAPGFDAGFVSWLGGTGADVELVRGPTRLRPGRFYVSAADRSLRFVAADQVEAVETLPPRAGSLHPNIDLLFSSLAEATRGRACGVLLTGMGRDGAQGLLSLRTAGGAAFAQDEQECAVFGMPRAALECGAVDRLSPIDELWTTLVRAFSGPEAAPGLVKEPGSDETRALRVLVAEDSPTMAALLTFRLEERGFAVTAVGSAEEAFEAATGAFAPDILLTDVNLPGASGLELCAGLRGEPGTENLPVLVLTGGAGPEQEEAAREAGAQGCLGKPFDLEDLIGRIHALTGS